MGGRRERHRRGIVQREERAGKEKSEDRLRKERKHKPRSGGTSGRGGGAGRDWKKKQLLDYDPVQGRTLSEIDSGKQRISFSRE